MAKPERYIVIDVSLAVPFDKYSDWTNKDFKEELEGKTIAQIAVSRGPLGHDVTLDEILNFGTFTVGGDVNYDAF